MMAESSSCGREFEKGAWEGSCRKEAVGWCVLPRSGRLGVFKGEQTGQKSRTPACDILATRQQLWEGTETAEQRTALSPEL